MKLSKVSYTTLLGVSHVQTECSCHKIRYLRSYVTDETFYRITYSNRLDRFMNSPEQRYSLGDIKKFVADVEYTFVSKELLEPALSIAVLKKCEHSEIRRFLQLSAQSTRFNSVEFNAIRALSVERYKELFDTIEMTESEFGSCIWTAAEKRSERFYLDFVRTGRGAIHKFFQHYRGERSPKSGSEIDLPEEQFSLSETGKEFGNWFKTHVWQRIWS